MHTIALPEKCDRSVALAMAPLFRTALAEGDLTLDGDNVQQVGQSMLQILVSARLSAALGGRQLSITASEKLRRTCRLTGLEQHILDRAVS